MKSILSGIILWMMILYPVILPSQSNLLPFVNSDSLERPAMVPLSNYSLNLLAKAQADECFYETGSEDNYYNPEGIDCDDCENSGGRGKTNQAYIWAQMKTGDSLWFSTAPNVQCLVMSQYLGDVFGSPFESASYVCELSESSYNSDFQYSLGDWRPTRIYLFDLVEQRLVDKTPPDSLLYKTVGLRSVGYRNDIILFAGPGLQGVNIFAFQASTGEYLGSQTWTAFQNIRKWIDVNGVLYSGVGTRSGGHIIRWTGSLSDPFTYETVGNLDSDAAEIAWHEGHLYVGTWPSEIGKDRASLFKSPAVSENGLRAKDTALWQKVWTVADYEPDPVIAATYGTGALASFEGYLYWGTMHVPLTSALVHFNTYPPDDLSDLVEGLGSTFRATSIFRSSDPVASLHNIELLYGMPEMPVYDTLTGWMNQANLMNQTPLWGSAGLGNPFNNYTWSMATDDRQLYIGTMDWSFLMQDFLVGLSSQIPPELTLDISGLSELSLDSILSQIPFDISGLEDLTDPEQLLLLLNAQDLFSDSLIQAVLFDNGSLDSLGSVLLSQFFQNEDFGGFDIDSMDLLQQIYPLILQLAPQLDSIINEFIAGMPAFPADSAQAYIESILMNLPLDSLLGSYLDTLSGSELIAFLGSDFDLQTTISLDTLLSMVAGDIPGLPLDSLLNEFFDTIPSVPLVSILELYFEQEGELTIDELLQLWNSGDGEIGLDSIIYFYFDSIPAVDVQSILELYFSEDSEISLDSVYIILVNTPGIPLTSLLELYGAVQQEVPLDTLLYAYFDTIPSFSVSEIVGILESIVGEAELDSLGGVIFAEFWTNFQNAVLAPYMNTVEVYFRDFVSVLPPIMIQTSLIITALDSLVRDLTAEVVHGADLYVIDNTQTPARAVFLNGGGNPTSYGIRNMTLSGNDLYLGMANPMNLRSCTESDEGKGGWELIHVDVSGMTSPLIFDFNVEIFGDSILFSWNPKTDSQDTITIYFSDEGQSDNREIMRLPAVEGSISMPLSAFGPNCFLNFYATYETVDTLIELPLPADLVNPLATLHGPSNVRLYVTEDQLTVSWLPDGSVYISSYLIEMTAGDSTKVLGYVDAVEQQFIAEMSITGLESYTVRSIGATGRFSCAVRAVQDTCFKEQLMVTKHDVSCSGQADGSITIGVTEKKPSLIWQHTNETESLTGLVAGEYYYFLTDSLGCEYGNSVQITEPLAHIIDISIIKLIACKGGSEGEISVAHSLESCEIQNLIWSTGDTTSVLSGLMSGEYSVSITDTAGCSITESIFLDDGVTLEGEVMVTGENDCLPDQDAMVILNISPSSSPVSSVTWDNGDTTLSVLGLTAGEHFVVINGEVGCVDTIHFEIDPIIPLVVDIELIQPVTCYGGRDGMIQFTASGGVLPNDTIQWRASRLASGLHTIELSDMRGCIAVDSLEIPDPEAIMISAFITDPLLCYGDSNAVVDLEITGAMAPFNYIYWSDGQEGTSASNLAGGIYNVTISDANGCRAESIIQIPDPDPLGVSVEVYPYFIEPWIAVVSVDVRNGISPYYYLWDEAILASGPEALIIDTGTYSVTIIDQNLCEETVWFYVAEPEIEFFQDGKSNDIQDATPIWIYPNPAEQKISIQTPFAVSGQLILTLLSGQAVLTQVVDGFETHVDLSALNDGPYMLFIMSEDKIWSRLVIKASR